MGLGILRVARCEVPVMESSQTAVCLFSQSVSKVCCFVKREVHLACD